MRSPYDNFIATARSRAEQNHINWCPAYDLTNGKIIKDEWWDLSAIAGKIERPRKVISSFGLNTSARAAISTIMGNEAPMVMSPHWIDLFKAIAIHDILIKGRTPGNFAINVGESFRILAGCADSVKPADITHDIVRNAYNAALLMSASGKRGSTLQATVSTWFDSTGIAHVRPLKQACVAQVENNEIADRVNQVNFAAKRQVDSKRPGLLRTELTQKHFEEKMPSEADLYELLRISYTAKPETFSDFVRLEATKILICTGLRVGEIVSLPAACLTESASERPLIGKHGPNRPDFLLHHFAEKQGQDARRFEFIEKVQHVPALFSSSITGSIARARSITAPLRVTVERQRQTGRLFPDLRDEDLVPWTEAYTRMTGMIRIAVEDVPDALKRKYRQNYDSRVLNDIREHQRHALRSSGASPRVNDYYRRTQSNSKLALYLRDENGKPIVLQPSERVSKRNLFVRAGDMEQFVRATMPTKLPDMRVGKATSGTFGLEDRLFLFPARARAEAAHDAIIDIERYFSVQSMSPANLELQLSGAGEGGRLFQRYGETDQAKQISINPHSLRHLQNTELFRQGVADTIITKRFSRRTTVQSYVYDHRTLAEHLDEMEPATLKAARNLGAHARKAFDLIRGGKIQGPVVETFKRIQQESGDETAFAYLNAEAGALHFTPYGFCLNSFAASPCVKHLECFNSCNHLVRTDSPEEQKNLETLKGRYELHIGRLKARPSPAPNFGAQLAHAEERLAGVQAALAQAPGTMIFPEGNDLYLSSGAIRNG